MGKGDNYMIILTMISMAMMMALAINKHAQRRDAGPAMAPWWAPVLVLP